MCQTGASSQTCAARRQLACPWPGPAASTCTSRCNEDDFSWSESDCSECISISDLLRLGILIVGGLPLLLAVLAAPFYFTQTQKFVSRGYAVGLPYLFIIVSVGDQASDVAYVLLSLFHSRLYLDLCLLFVVLPLVPPLLLFLSALVAAARSGHLSGLLIFKNHLAPWTFLAEIVLCPLRLALGFTLFMCGWSSRLLAWRSFYAAVQVVVGIPLPFFDQVIDRAEPKAAVAEESAVPEASAAIEMAAAPRPDSQMSSSNSNLGVSVSDDGNAGAAAGDAAASNDVYGSLEAPHLVPGIYFRSMALEMVLESLPQLAVQTLNAVAIGDFTTEFYVSSAFSAFMCFNGAYRILYDRCFLRQSFDNMTFRRRRTESLFRKPDAAISSSASRL